MTTKTPTDQAIAVMEDFRARIRAIGQTTPALEQFIDNMNVLLSLQVAPATALDALFRALAEMEPANQGATSPVGAGS